MNEGMSIPVHHVVCLFFYKTVQVARIAWNGVFCSVMRDSDLKKHTLVFYDKE